MAHLFLALLCSRWVRVSGCSSLSSLHGPRHGCPATNHTNRQLAAWSEQRCFTAARRYAQLRPRSQSPGCRARREGVSALSVRLGGTGGSGDAVAPAPAPPAAAGQSGGGKAALGSGAAAAADPEDGYAVDVERDSGAAGDDMPPRCARPRMCCARAQQRRVGGAGRRRLHGARRSHHPGSVLGQPPGALWVAQGHGPRSCASRSEWRPGALARASVAFLVLYKAGTERGARGVERKLPAG